MHYADRGPQNAAISIQVVQITPTAKEGSLAAVKTHYHS